MFIRNWLSLAEIRRIGIIVAIYLAAIAGVVTVAVALGRPSGEYINQQAKNNQADGVLWAPLIAATKPSPSKYEASCTNPKDREEADLCQQWRAANAAIESAASTRTQWFWNIVQDVLTLAAVGCAAWAAAAAQKTLWHAQTSSERELRAYVNLKSAHLVFGIGQRNFGREIFVDLVFENFGQTPVHNAVLTGCVLVGDRSQDFIGQNYGSVGPSGQIKFRTTIDATVYDLLALTSYALKRTSTPRISVKGLITYTTVFPEIDRQGLRNTTFSLFGAYPYYDFPREVTRQQLGYHMVAWGEGNKST